MTRLVYWVFGLLISATALARAADFPEFRHGQSEIRFETPAPQSSTSELLRRLGDSTFELPGDYDLAREKFQVWIGAEYTHEAAWGLLVWVSASDGPRFPDDWANVLAEHKLLVIGAQNSGNQRNPYQRCRLAVDAVFNMEKRFHIDPDRVYVAGGSGGGRISSILGVAYGDVFRGAFPMIGTDFYKRIPFRGPNTYIPPTYTPLPQVLAAAKKRNRYVLLTGETDGNRPATIAIYKRGFRAEGFRNVRYLLVPGMGHSLPPADWLEQGLDFLDVRTPSKR
jgi:hypothetical protein